MSKNLAATLPVVMRTCRAKETWAPDNGVAGKARGTQGVRGVRIRSNLHLGAPPAVERKPAGPCHTASRRHTGYNRYESVLYGCALIVLAYTPPGLVYCALCQWDGWANIAEIGDIGCPGTEYSGTGDRKPLCTGRAKVWMKSNAVYIVRVHGHVLSYRQSCKAERVPRGMGWGSIAAAGQCETAVNRRGTAYGIVIPAAGAVPPAAQGPPGRRTKI